MRNDVQMLPMSDMCLFIAFGSRIEFECHVFKNNFRDHWQQRLTLHRNQIRGCFAYSVVPIENYCHPQERLVCVSFLFQILKLEILMSTFSQSLLLIL